METTDKERLETLERAFTRQSRQLQKIRFQLYRINLRNEELASIVVALGKKVISMPVEKNMLEDNKGVRSNPFLLKHVEGVKKK